MQLLCYLAAYALYAAYGFAVELLRGELDGGVARVYACKLNVFAYGVGDNLAVAGHGVHLNLLGVLYELAHHYGMIL